MDAEHPGGENGLTYQGKPLRNWRIFIGEYDQRRKRT
jgi:hypothetical protein